MDSTDSLNDGHRGRKDRSDEKRTQNSRSRSPDAGLIRLTRPSHPHNNMRHAESHITGPPGEMSPPPRPPTQTEHLVKAYEETTAKLPSLLNQFKVPGGVSSQAVASMHEVLTSMNLPMTTTVSCPGLPQVVIRVTKEDTLNAAIRLAKEAKAVADAAATTTAAAKAAAKAAFKEAENNKPEKKDDTLSVSSTSSTTSTSSNSFPWYPNCPLIVNFANHQIPGGAWNSGCMAQEEATFYRTSLSLSLDRKLYPIRDNAVVYSPFVVIIREEFAAGHRLLKPEDMVCVSAVSAAALRQPPVRKVQVLKRGQPEEAHFSPPKETPSLPKGNPLSPPKAKTTSPALRRKALNEGRMPLLWDPDARPLPFAGTGESFASSRMPCPPRMSSQEVLNLLHKKGIEPPKASPPLLSPALPYIPCPLPLNPDWVGSREMARARNASAASADNNAPMSRRPEPELQRVERVVYQSRYDRELTKLKMRLVLRTAAKKGHRQLVLGALGCGVLGNPPEDVARCWLEVLHEDEFKVPVPGGQPVSWWTDIVFAVYEGSKRDATDTNYEIFKRILDGKLA